MTDLLRYEASIICKLVSSLKILDFDKAEDYAVALDEPERLVLAALSEVFGSRDLTGSEQIIAEYVARNLSASLEPLAKAINEHLKADK